VRLPADFRGGAALEDEEHLVPRVVALRVAGAVEPQ
jgi:hypothetical protein